MSFTELLQEVERLTPEEQERLRRHLAVKSLQETPEWRDEMDRRIERVRAGHGYGADELMAIHEKLKAEGR